MSIVVDGGNNIGLGGVSDIYNFPALNTMLAFNVPVSDINGQNSHQKWIVGGDGAYNAVANSLEGQKAYTSVFGNGNLSMLSKTYTFDKNVDLVIDGRIKYNIAMNYFTGATRDFSTTPLTNERSGVVGDSVFYFGTYVNSGSRRNEVSIVGVGGNASDVNVEGYYTPITLDVGGVVGTGPTPLAVSNPSTGVDSSGRALAIVRASATSTAPGGDPLAIGVIYSDGNGSYYTATETGFVLGNTVTYDVREDGTNLYINYEFSTAGVPRYITIEKSTGTATYSGTAPAGFAGATTITLSNSLGTGIGTHNIGNLEVTGSFGSFPSNEILIEGGYAGFDTNTTPVTVSATINGTPVGSDTFTPSSSSSFSNSEITFSSIDIIDAIDATIELTVTNSTNLPLELGFGAISSFSSYRNPGKLVDNDLSGDATIGRSAGGDGTYISIQNLS